MKKIILAIGLMFGGVAFVNAQQTQQQDTTQTQQSDQYRTDTTSTDDSQNRQYQDQTQSDTTSTQQSDMYRTEGEGNVSDSTSNNTDESTTNDTDAASNQTTTGTESNTTETESTTTGSTGTPTTDDQMSSDQSGVSQDQEQEGEKIEVSELPAAVQTKLQSNDYQGWVVTSARKKMWSDPDNAQAASKEVYVIEAKNGSETKKLKFDKDGNEIEHDKHKKDDQK